MIPVGAIPLTVLPNDGGSRVRRDRLELLTTLIDAPGFDPLYRSDIINVPPHHAIYGWRCVVETCERGRKRSVECFCTAHYGEWLEATEAEMSRADFLRNAQPCPLTEGKSPNICLICPGRPADSPVLRLCSRHHDQWRRTHALDTDTNLEEWIAAQVPLDTFGVCRVLVCLELADSMIGLCPSHNARYVSAGRPGSAALPKGWAIVRENRHQPPCVSYHDEAAFRRWCTRADPAYRVGVLNLAGLQPLVKAEIQWGLHAHALSTRRTLWEVVSLQRLANVCRRQGFPACSTWNPTVVTRA